MWRYNSVDNDLGKQVAFNKGYLILEAIYTNNKTIRFDEIENPDVSIVIVSYNAPELLCLTLTSLSSQRLYNNATFEVVVVDNHSEDRTQKLLDKLDGVQVIKLNDNAGFGAACNIGAKQSRGALILFLNPDIELMPGCIDAMIKTINQSPTVGCVGGRLIWPGGQLQEAGSMLLDDEQITYPYERGGNPFAPEVLYRRESGYVSGALLLTRREVFFELQGFDSEFHPAYFEDTDFCIRSWRAGYKVIYEPDATAIHFESATSKNRKSVEKLLHKNRKIFKDRYYKWLFSSIRHENYLCARDFSNPTMRVLIVDDQVPHTDLGAGLPRMNIIIKLMLELGYFVSIYPLYACDASINERYRDISREVEILGGEGGLYIKDILKNRIGYYDVFWISRPHNIRYLLWEMKNIDLSPRSFTKGTIVFDCEALYSLREEVERMLSGDVITSQDVDDKISKEISGYDLADCVVSVSDSETDRLLKKGVNNAVTLGHSFHIENNFPKFDERSGLLFIGSLKHENAPNADSIRWFLNEVWDNIRYDSDELCDLTIIGDINDNLRNEFARDGVKILGRIENISEYIDKARVMIAPTRFASGIPMKVHESIARGLPVVVTKILEQQMGWPSGTGYVSADWTNPQIFCDAIKLLYNNKKLWHETIINGQKVMEKECGIDNYKEKIRIICEKNRFEFI